MKGSVSVQTALLLAVLAAGLALRLYNLVPPERGLLFAADADEGIYAASARLALDGYLPYRDFFCSAPPLGLYLFMAVLAPTSPPWGDVTGFMALRYTAVAYGMITLGAVFALGRRLGGPAAGLAAAALLAIDGWSIAQDRRAMLEAPLNMFSALALLAAVAAGQRQDHRLRLYALAGALAALAISSKTQGAVVLLAIVGALLLQRHWRSALVAAGAAAATYLVLSLPYLLAAGDDLVRQLFLFQFLRPPNGDPALMLRVNAIRGYAESWLSVRLGLLGGLVLAARLLWRPSRSSAVVHWLPVLLWGLLVAASFAASKTFYLYYYAQLAPPLALLAGSLFSLGGQATSGRQWLALSWSRLSERARRPAGREAGTLPTARPSWPSALAQVALAVIVAMLVAWRLPTQAQATLQGTRWIKNAYAGAGAYLHDNAPREAEILVFEPNHTFLASRRPARAADGTFFVDSHAYMLYINLGIKSATYAELVRQVAARAAADEQTVLWRQPAQDLIGNALNTYDYVVVDRRARYLLSPATLNRLESATTEVARFSDTSVRRK